MPNPEAPELPPELTRILGAGFESAGFELFLVGGALRDTLLGRPVRELDLATDARPECIVDLLKRLAPQEGHGRGAGSEAGQGRAPWPEGQSNSPSFPAAPHEGWSIYRVGEKFGTIGMVAGDLRTEITTYRSGERYPAYSRKPDVTFGNSIEQDLARRDFTINAMARPACSQGLRETADASLIDPFGGRRDLNGHLIRAVGAPSERFREDGLRLLRGVRFAAELSFEVEAQTWQAMQECGSLLQGISRERIADELNRMLEGSDPARAFTILRDSGLLENAEPLLLTLAAMPDHGPNHPLSLWDHTMRVVAAVPPDRISRWAALLHDIGKPDTRSFENGRIRFPDHEQVGGLLARRIMRSLRMSNELVTSVVGLVETHMQVHQYTNEWSDGAVRRLCDRLGSNFLRAMALARADAEAHGDTVWGRSRVDALENRARELKAQLPEIKSPLNGDELIAHYGRRPGRWIGDVKEALIEKVVEGELRPEDKQAAWREADRLLRQPATGTDQSSEVGG